jgi:hypothetical protein
MGKWVDARVVNELAHMLPVHQGIETPQNALVQMI